MLKNQSSPHRLASPFGRNQLEQEHDHPLSYSTMVADIDQEENKGSSLPIAQSKRSPNHFHPFNQESAHSNQKQFESAGPSNINHQYKVPYQLTTRKTEPGNHESPDSKALGGFPKRPPLSPRTAHLPQPPQPPKVQKKTSENLSPKGFDMRKVNSIVRKDVCGVGLTEGVEEQSCIVDPQDQSSSLSHFSAVQFQDSSDQKETPTTPKDSKNNYIILTKEATKRTQDNGNNRKSQSPIQFHQSRDSPKYQDSKSIKKGLPSEASEKFRPKVEEPAKGKEEEQDKLLSSLIIRKTSIEEIRHARVEKPANVGEDENKKMKLTYDLRGKDSAFKTEYNGGNFSEPDRRDSKPKTHKNPFINFEESDEERNSQENQEEHCERVIFQRLGELLGMLQDIPTKDDEQIEKKLASILRDKLSAKKSKKTKIEDIRQIVPEELFNGFSSVDSRERQLRKPSKELSGNSQVYLEINRIKSKVQEIQRKHLGKSDQLRDFKRGSKKNLQFSVNFREEKDPSVRVSFRPNCEEVGLTQSDDEFEDVERTIPRLPRTPRANDGPQQLTDLGIEAFERVGVKADHYLSMDLSCNKEGVFFDLHKGPKIRWDYSGLFRYQQLRVRGRNISRELEGEGVEIIPGTHFYKGEFFKNKKSGYGVVIRSNGDKYRGYWKNDLFNGRGKLIGKESVYEGQFTDGLKEGHGVEFFTKGDCFEGEYRRGLFHGNGVYTWKNGTIYQGEFREHEMEGRGFWQSPRGDTYEGSYQRSLKHGFGVYHWGNGRSFQGQFEHGRMLSKKSPKNTLPVQKQISIDLSQANKSSGEERRSIEGNRFYTIQNLSSPSQRNLPRSGHY